MNLILFCVCEYLTGVWCMLLHPDGDTDAILIDQPQHGGLRIAVDDSVTCTKHWYRVRAISSACLSLKVITYHQDQTIFADKKDGIKSFCETLFWLSRGWLSLHAKLMCTYIWSEQHYQGGFKNCIFSK